MQGKKCFFLREDAKQGIPLWNSLKLLIDELKNLVLELLQRGQRKPKENPLRMFLFFSFSLTRFSFSLQSTWQSCISCWKFWMGSVRRAQLRNNGNAGAMQILKRVAIGANFICTLLGAAVFRITVRAALALCARLFAAPCVNFACKKSRHRTRREKKNKWQRGAAAIEARGISAVGYWTRRERSTEAAREITAHITMKTFATSLIVSAICVISSTDNAAKMQLLLAAERPAPACLMKRALLSRVNVDVRATGKINLLHFLHHWRVCWLEAKFGIFGTV